MSNRKDLLNQLSMQNEPPALNRHPKTLLVISFIVVVLAFILFFLTDATDLSAQAKTNTGKNASGLANDVVSTKLTSIADAGLSHDTPALNQSVHTDKVLDASGYITPRRVATVSSKVMGLIASVNVEEGMYVKEGQLLAEVDSSLATLGLSKSMVNIQVLRARKKGIEANLLEKETMMQRLKTLKNKEHIGDALVTENQTEVAVLSSSLAAILAEIKLSEIEILIQEETVANHKIRAPFSGVVTEKNAQPGEIVAPSSAGGGFTRTGICTIVDMDSLEIEVDVSESYIGRIFSGQDVVANLEAYPDWNIAGKVIAIIPTADRAKATVSVRVSVEEKDDRILPNMGVKVAFLESR